MHTNTRTVGFIDVYKLKVLTHNKTRTEQNNTEQNVRTEQNFLFTVCFKQPGDTRPDRVLSAV